MVMFRSRQEPVSGSDRLRCRAAGASDRFSSRTLMPTLGLPWEIAAQPTPLAPSSGQPRHALAFPDWPRPLKRRPCRVSQPYHGYVDILQHQLTIDASPLAALPVPSQSGRVSFRGFQEIGYPRRGSDPQMAIDQNSTDWAVGQRRSGSRGVVRPRNSQCLVLDSMKTCRLTEAGDLGGRPGNREVTCLAR